MVSKTRKNKEKQDFQAICFADEASRNAAYQDIEERRLKEWENYQKSHRTPEDQKTNRAFIDVSVGDILAGRLVIDLYDTLVPRTVERFRAMITGELGVDKGTGTKIDYLHTKLQCIDRERSLLCFGSFAMNIVPPIQDENYSVRHTERGLLTMMSHGPNTARSGFGITLGPAPCLDFKQVAFGKIVDGISVLEKLEKVPVNSVGKPLNSPFITFCGILTGQAPPGVWEYRREEDVLEEEPDESDVEDPQEDEEDEQEGAAEEDLEEAQAEEEELVDEEGNAEEIQEESKPYEETVEEHTESSGSEKVSGSSMEEMEEKHESSSQETLDSEAPYQTE
eukprot:gene11575-7971_t